MRGPSPWKRAVRAGAHVLVCPDCQLEPNWTARLDHCHNCGSWRLVRQLGAVTCRACGTAADATIADDAIADDAVPDDTAVEATMADVAGRPNQGPPAARASENSAGERPAGDRSKLAADVHAALERMWRRAGDAADR